MPIGDIRVALQSGSPLLLSKLFFSDHDDRASELRKVIQIAADHGVSSEAFESWEEGEAYVAGESDHHCIDLSHVLNILAEWEQGLERSQDLEDERGRG